MSIVTDLKWEVKFPLFDLKIAGLRGVVVDENFDIDAYPVMQVSISRDWHVMAYHCPWCDRWHEHKIHDRVHGKPGDADKLKAGKAIRRMTHCDVWCELFPDKAKFGRDYVRLKLSLTDAERRLVLRVPG